ncbi:two-CW domain-containing protein [Thermodesulfobacteriota bacterium]
MPKYLTVHEESDVDRTLLESRWTEISMEQRAAWDMTLFNMELGKRFCEWDAPSREVLEQVFREMGIKWTEILEAEVTTSTQWRRWGTQAPPEMVNCWEMIECGRNPGGVNAEEKGVCPAAVDNTVKGKNRGLGGGRCCWRVVGTFCDDKVQDSYAEKMRDCAACDFFRQVKSEEGANFEP